VAGPAFMKQARPDRLSREDQLPDFLASRVGVTTLKVMFAAAQLYVEGMFYTTLTVEGADVQAGRGNATRKRVGDKVYIRGTEAAHFGIGTIKRQGEAFSVSAARQAVIWQKTSGYPASDPRASFDANGELAGIGLECDASTFLEPGFMNQSDGLLERSKQTLLLAFTPRVLPNDLDALERTIRTLAVQTAVQLLSDHASVITPIENRLAVLGSNTGESEYLQDPTDTANFLFGGRERTYLERLLDLHRSPSSDLHKAVDEIIRAIPGASRSLAELADEGRQERVGAPTFVPTPT
jgi:hypothetical protein